MINGKVAYLGNIRSQNALLCAQGAVGRMLIQRFTILGERFPSPLEEAWFKTALWLGENPSVNVSYDQQLAGVNSALNGARNRANGGVGIIVKKKTHAWRVAGARALDEAGIDDQVHHIS
jgi:hypothetical protein